MPLGIQVLTSAKMFHFHLYSSSRGPQCDLAPLITGIRRRCERAENRSRPVNRFHELDIDSTRDAGGIERCRCPVQVLPTSKYFCWDQTAGVHARRHGGIRAGDDGRPSSCRHIGGSVAGQTIGCGIRLICRCGKRIRSRTPLVPSGRKISDIGLIEVFRDPNTGRFTAFEVLKSEACRELAACSAHARAYSSMCRQILNSIPEDGRPAPIHHHSADAMANRGQLRPEFTWKAMQIPGLLAGVVHLSR